MSVTLTKQQMELAMLPVAKQENIDKYFDALLQAMAKYDISTYQRIAFFLAQVCHESGGFSAVSENLNYSSDRLLVVFPKYFTSEALIAYYQSKAHQSEALELMYKKEKAKRFASDFHRQPEKIANYVYGGRMGNREESSGDGWRFRGRGLIGTTGAENYLKTGQGIGVDLIKNPDLLTVPKYAALSAAWFWKSRLLNEVADSGNFDMTTYKINGGKIGAAERIKWLQRWKKVFNI